ncbi:hypothetical protein [Komagataeibacter oboediens]|uniref:hypothetical protein n=1 Tax=Komagataeibacter oboediens TaxID=65958 RepID=UPI001906A37C|nr:hypothetical protein [Komagataeibacter oboediens]
MKSCRQPATGLPDGPDLPPYFMDTGIMLVRPDSRAVDYPIFIGGISSLTSENPLDHAIFAPAAQSRNRVGRSWQGMPACQLTISLFPFQAAMLDISQ